mmetsp:Transcript_5662/g.7238  ORF Transcript_5662/g.7238 Transcript_5662/m.7238 type:complete len:305 (+) Transcript_5662:93-1007(+)
MADAAAFFASKKKTKKKKTFKLNANKVDASQIISTTHIDAPEVSTESNTLTTSSEGAGGDWDESALASKLQIGSGNKNATGGTAELLDMKTFQSRGNEKDDIKEKLRTEEIKAKLAAARDGMKKEEERLKEEKVKKEKKEEDSRFGAAAANLGGTVKSTTWLPPHMRAANSNVGRGMLGSSMSSSSGFQRKIDTDNEELFPDLATADKIIAQEEEQKQQAARRTKPTASPWGAQKKAAPAPVKESQTEKKKEDDIVTSKKESSEEKAEITPAPVSTPVTTAASVVEGLKKKPKKKKKDLSTFKA